MITCKVGNEIINCFDNKYDKYKLKVWSDKSLLRCPDCNGLYEYCHGEVASPYFRHKGKSKICEEFYSEPETQEHIEGKEILYKYFLKFQEDGVIKNLRLEGYIPETKQKPDVYFEIEDKRYVFEFQCSPISTEYINRHELYKLARIDDCWIMGTAKYNLKIEKDSVIHMNYYKTIEEFSNYYLDVESRKICFAKKLFNIYLNLEPKYFKSDYFLYDLNDFKLSDKGILFLKDCVLDSIKNKILKKIEADEERRLSRIENASRGFKIKEDLCKIYNNSKNIEVKYLPEHTVYYLWGLKCIINGEIYSFFIKENNIDFCKLIQYSKRSRFILIHSFEINNKQYKDIFKIVENKISSLLK